MESAAGCRSDRVWHRHQADYEALYSRQFAYRQFRRSLEHDQASPDAGGIVGEGNYCQRVKDMSLERAVIDAEFLRDVGVIHSAALAMCDLARCFEEWPRY